MTVDEKRRARHLRYNHSAKGRARRKRHEVTEKRAEGYARYNRSDKGKARLRKSAAKRVWIGRKPAGTAPTVELADKIQAFINRRIHEFKSR